MLFQMPHQMDSFCTNLKLPLCPSQYSPSSDQRCVLRVVSFGSGFSSMFSDTEVKTDV